MNKPQPTESFTIKLYPSETEGMWIAYDADRDLLADGESEFHALAELGRIIGIYKDIKKHTNYK